MAVYVLLIVVGDFIAYGIGIVVDRFSPTLSLPIFLAVFFAVFWLGWLLAVRLTEPKAEPSKVG